jgi:phosphotransferase system enzyme I (PtsI)
MNSEIDTNEISLTGLPGSPGIVIGKASLYKRRRPVISNTSIQDDHIDQQIEEFHQARNLAEQELERLLDNQSDESALELIHTQIEMLKDPDLCDRVEREIEENNQPADMAIHKVFEEYLAIFKKNQEEAFRERSVDIADIRDRLLQILNNHHTDEIEEGTILVAHELSPREVIEFSQLEIKGIIMDHGGTTSHAAIIARSMNIPTVVGVKKATNMIDSQQTVVLDGEHGEVIVNPEKKTREKYRDLMKRYVEAQSDLEKICAEPDETADQKPFVLRANIEFTEELESIKKYQARGIGLLRTESIYLRRKHFENQEKQEEFYGVILEDCDPQPVTIRLFDAGGDKFFNLGSKEQNPFLGWRGIRMLLDEEPLLRKQLKAILKTAAKHHGCVRLLVPMISTINEVLRVKEVMFEIQGELMQEGVPVDEELQFGIMVEVPSVAIQAEKFADHADFFSIGTNDLTQYVMAVDRGNELISGLYNQCHPAIWKLIKQVVDAANKKKISVSVCGELASDPIAACGLMGLGINELSMGPTILPAVKNELRSHTFDEMQQLAEKLVTSSTIEDINTIFNNWKST